MSRMNLAILAMLLLSTQFNMSLLVSDVVINPRFEPSLQMWADDFDDLNYDGWTISGYDRVSWQDCLGNFSAYDGTLKSVGLEIDVASHASSNAYGSWVFDVKVVYNESSQQEFLSPLVFFSTSNWSSMEHNRDGYAVRFSCYNTSNGEVDIDTRIELGYFTPDPAGAYWTSLDVVRPIHAANGWQHVEIIRTFSNQFSMSINQTYHLQAIDDTYTSAEVFRFMAKSGEALDNISVSGITDSTSDTTSTTSDTTDDTESIIKNLLIPVGVGAAAFIVVMVILWKRKHNHGN